MTFIEGQNYGLQDGLRKASAVAVSLRLRAEAAAIAMRAPHNRPDTWSFCEHFADRHVFPFLFHVALTAALKNAEVQEQHIIPTELVPICKGMKSELSGAEFRKELKKRLEKCWRASREED